ncbi:MAG: hypothetical protein JSU94_03240 [Phycisphaerales bacterium]|nr:MAG: hypothetical protein JSU94_03240 [Phycisphaerales bacterium]
MKKHVHVVLVLAILAGRGARGADWDLKWIGGTEPEPPWNSWHVQVEGDVVTFGGPTGFATNSCEATKALGGTPTVTIDHDNKRVLLGFQPLPPAAMWPECWDCPYQCRGDTDCQSEGPFKYRVGTNDLWRWIVWWKSGADYDPCLDFNHDGHIDGMDEAIFESWYMKPNVPYDCPCRPLHLGPMEPNSLAAGSVRTIRWTDIPADCSRSYYLQYSTDNGQSWEEVDANTIENACSYDWLVPAASSEQCLLRVSDANPPIFPDAYPPNISDTSYKPFAIYECQGPGEGDLDGSCYVDFRDFAVLVSSWPVGPDLEQLAGFAEDWCSCGNPYDPACGVGGGQ